MVLLSRMKKSQFLIHLVIKINKIIVIFEKVCNYKAKKRLRICINCSILKKMNKTLHLKKRNYLEKRKRESRKVWLQINIY